MRNFFKQSTFFYLICIPFAVSCQKASPPQNSFNAYLPPLLEEETEIFDAPSLTETPLPSEPKKTDEWDDSDIDISYIDRSRKLIAFTFDDAPSKTLESIFITFAEYNEQNPDCRASATLFFNGSLIDNHSLQYLYTARILGFELGNHTHSHLDLTTLSDEKLREEIDRTDELLARADKKERHLLRAPFGRIDERIKALSPVPLIDWTIDTLDWTGRSADEIYDTVFQNRFSGAIVLMHDGYRPTVDALKRLLPALKADGYQAVSVSAMAKAHGCKLQRGKVYIRARKQ